MGVYLYCELCQQIRGKDCDPLVNTTIGTWQLPDVVRWTDVPPTEAGWYWWKPAYNETAEVVGLGRTGRMQLAGHEQAFNATGLGGQWWPTPIEPPNG